MLSDNDEKIKAFLKYLDKYRFIAHRLGSAMEGYPENSFENIISIFNNKESLACCNGFEFDMQVTLDGVPVAVHDYETADIGEKNRFVFFSTYDKIKHIKCGYRKSEYNSNIPWEENNNFYLRTIDDFLSFFADNRDKLGDRVIKIESKFPILKKGDLIAFKNLLKKYSTLNENIIHISFFPWHLHNLRVLQKEEGPISTKTELLADFSCERKLFKSFTSYRDEKSFIDGISLGVKSERVTGNMKINRDAKSMANFIAFFTQNRNAVSEDWLGRIIKTYEYAGIYTINTPQDIIELLSRISPNFLEEYADKLVITSDNPKYFKQLQTIQN